MEYPTIKIVWFDRPEITLAYAMVRVVEINRRSQQLSKHHRGICDKLHISKMGMSVCAKVFVQLSEEECKLLREYNAEYCEILATKMAQGDQDGITAMTDAEALHLYTTANRIMKVLSSL